MDRTAEYAQIVRRVMEELADYVPDEPGIRKELVLDDAGGHYQLTLLGWQDKRRVHSTLVHMDVRDGKVWLEHDGTNLELAQDLIDAGIPEGHIVMGFHPPELRKYTEFAHV